MFADVCPPSQQPDGDELCVDKSEQCLPRYLVHFKRTAKRRTGEVPLEMRNATNIILWLDPHLKVRFVFPRPSSCWDMPSSSAVLIFPSLDQKQGEASPTVSGGWRGDYNQDCCSSIRF